VVGDFKKKIYKGNPGRRAKQKRDFWVGVFLFQRVVGKGKLSGLTEGGKLGGSRGSNVRSRGTGTLLVPWGGGGLDGGVFFRGKSPLGGLCARGHFKKKGSN